jgi:hypothetical protein
MVPHRNRDDGGAGDAQLTEVSSGTPFSALQKSTRSGSKWEREGEGRRATSR